MQPGSNMDVSTSSYACPNAGQTLATCTSSLVAVAPFTAQMKKGGYGNPTDERRNTQLAIKLIF